MIISKTENEHNVNGQEMLVGIDVAKQTHVARILLTDGRESKAFSFHNTREGFESLMSWLMLNKMRFGCSSILAGLESTGHYWEALAFFLDGKNDIRLVQVNPKYVKKTKELYDNSPGKTDSKDAGVIAMLIRMGKYTFDFFNRLYTLDPFRRTLYHTCNMEDIKLIGLDLSVLSDELIEVLLLDSYAEPSLFEEIAQKNTHRPEVLRMVLNHPRTPENVRQFAAQKLQVPVPQVAPSAVSAEQLHEDEHVREQRTESLLRRIQKMRVGEKIQLALRGSRDIRSILIRDPNKEVMLTVLENNRITESEIEIIAKQKTSQEEALRAIANKREWLKNYSIVHALVTNPKTPIPIALKHVLSIRTKDLALIEKNKNVSEAVRASAKRLIAARRIS